MTTSARLDRRVLVIAYYFPPSGGSGVQRTLKLVRYLRDFGWEPVVLTVADGEYPNLDPSLAAEVPPGVAVYRSRAIEPFGLYKKLLGHKPEAKVSVGFLNEGSAGTSWREKLARAVRGNVFIPDARIGWLPGAVRLGQRAIREQGIQAIYSSGPPHTAHLIGRSLARKTGLPWLADFRDPWTDIDFIDELRMGRVARWLNARLERSVLREATVAVTVSPSWARMLSAKVPGKTVRVVTNGYDPADFVGVQPIIPATFSVTHVGNLVRARNPDGLLRAAAALAREDAGFARDFELASVGNIDGATRATMEALGLGASLRHEPYMPHAEALRHVLGAPVLLLMVNDAPNQAGVLPAKLYEYLGSGRPVLAIGPPTGDIATILRDTNGGAVLGYDDIAGLKAELARLYAAWRADRATDRPITIPPDPPPAVRRYTRRALTGQIAALLG